MAKQKTCMAKDIKGQRKRAHICKSYKKKL